MQNDQDQKQANIGDLLGSLPTPSLIVELSLMEKYLRAIGENCSVEEFLQDPSTTLENVDSNGADSGAFFIHTSVTSTSKRDVIVQQEGSGKSLSVCEIDASVGLVGPAGAYLGLGLANHHVGGYYWARSMGIGASLPAHGIYFGPSSHSIDNNGDTSQSNTTNGELSWRKRGPGDPAETTQQSSNSNDGKRSEWADFLKVGDTVQLVPNDPLYLLVACSDKCESRFDTLLGLRREGRPLGADPIVERIWKRDGQHPWTAVA